VTTHFSSPISTIGQDTCRGSGERTLIGCKVPGSLGPKEMFRTFVGGPHAYGSFFIPFFVALDPPRHPHRWPFFPTQSPGQTDFFSCFGMLFRVPNRHLVSPHPSLTKYTQLVSRKGWLFGNLLTQQLVFFDLVQLLRAWAT